MKLSCTRENLDQALSIVGGGIGKNINLPILQNILLRATEQKIEVVATDLDLAISVHVRGRVDVVGSFTVPAKMLTECVRLLSDEKIELEVKENELLVVCGKSSTKIKGTVADDFPVVPSVGGELGYVVSADLFKSSLSVVLPAVAKNDIRPELAGIYFGFNTYHPNTLTLAATDSYRLAEKQVELTQGGDVLPVIVPGHTAQELQRVVTLTAAPAGEMVRLVVGENQIAMRYGEVEVVSRVVEGKFPDYTQIIPREFKTTTECDVEKLTKEVRAAGLFTTGGVNAVALDFNVSEGTVGVSSTSNQTGEYVSEIPAEIQGEENSILLNHKYVLDGLTSLNKETVVIKMISGENPCIFAAKDDLSFLYIVMPVRQ